MPSPTDESTHLRDGCQTALAAFNQLPNTRLSAGIFKDTYEVAAYIEGCLRTSADIQRARQRMKESHNPFTSPTPPIGRTQ